MSVYELQHTLCVPPHRSLSYSLSLQWFILFLQLLVIIAIPVLSLMGKIHSVKLFMIHMLAILSTLWLTFANTVCRAAYHSCTQRHATQYTAIGDASMNGHQVRVPQHAH